MNSRPDEVRERRCSVTVPDTIEPCSPDGIDSVAPAAQQLEQAAACARTTSENTVRVAI